MSTTLPPVTYTILDGGMGTTLEDSGHDVSSHLWSSDPKLRGAVRDVHQGFLGVGAGMVGTATYQACESLYTANDLMSPDQAEEMMRSQVGVAREATASVVGSRGGKIGLCLGPFGATLQPGQEYSGLYPAPYGPSSSSTHTDSPETTSTCISSLRQFHLDRLLTYARDETTWRSIDWVCFETIPLVREGLAIRSAIKGLWRELSERYGAAEGQEDGCWWMKPFWMAFVFPKGVFPDGSDVRQVVRTSVLKDPYASESSRAGLDGVEEDEKDLPIPNAIGINCTSPAHIYQLGSEFTRYLGEIMDQDNDDSSQPPISLGFVLYPDGGLVYDTTTRSWSAPSTTDIVAGSSGNGNWAENVAKVARRIGETTRSTSTGDVERVWKGGVLVGGCCKNGFEEIRGLARALTVVKGE